jgi:hypothetical protein
MSAEIQAKTRALQRAGLFTTLSPQEASSADGVDSSDKTLAARVHQPLLSLRLYGCGAYVCRNPGRNTRYIQVAGHPATSLNQEALSVMVLTRRIRL